MAGDRTTAASAPRACLADFGLARFAATGSHLTTTGQAVGTPAYMSPEQARGATGALTPAADVWALGCVLYEMLAGRPAFAGDTTAAVIGHILTTPPTPLRRLRPDLPAGLAAVAAACLAPSLAGRYPDAGVLRGDLDRVLAGESPRPPRAGGRRRAGAASLLAMAGAVAVAVAWSGGPSGPAAPHASAGAGPTRARDLAARGRELRHTDPRGALTALDAAVALDARAGWLRLERAPLRWCLGDHVGARADWEAVSPDDPAFAEAQGWLLVYEVLQLHIIPSEGPAQRLAAQGGRPAAIARATIALAEHRWDDARAALDGLEGWEILMLRGYGDARDPAAPTERAIAAYRAALAEGPPLAWAYGELTALLNRQLDYVAALAAAETALRWDPGCPEALCNRGSALASQGHTAAALADFGAALRILEDPAHPLHGPVARADTLTNRAITYLRQGDLGAAEADLERALTLAPGRAPALEERGRLRLTRGDTAGAVADFSAVLVTRPHLASVWMARGSALRDLGDLDRAAADFREAVRLEPGNGAAHANLGVIAFDRGEWAAAAAAFREFVRLAPDDPRAAEVRDLIAECEAKIGG